VSDPTDREDILRKIKADGESPARIEDLVIPLEHVAAKYDLKEALEACRSLKTKTKPWKKAHQPDIGKAKHNVDSEILEHDFTTRNGTHSNLDCPFAKITNGDPPKETSDPIAAEFHGDGSVGSGTAYAQQNPNKCPIRYLDQHSPEEVAKYFENHKHEIPRSHAICISRYQQNDAKIRQLDAKYGNLRDMIQSLGVQHQQYLPAKDRQEHVRRPSSPPVAVAVEQWAGNVSRRSAEADAAPIVAQTGENGAEDEDQGERVHNFERPLREIRLGESPSRPWGIAVPLAQETAASAVPSDKGIEPLSLDGLDADHTPTAEKQKAEEKPAARCPFDPDASKKALPNGVCHGGDTAAGEAQTIEPSSSPQMIFHGPVFFGYSPEQVKALMQSGVFDPGKT
jgi:hypothetical protein